MNKLLLQVCCAPCGTYISLERLRPCYDLTWYFYNPNLFSLEEYERRLEAVNFVADKFKIPLIVANYEHDTWRQRAACWANSPERGERCQYCYRERLAQTAKLAKKCGFDIFGSTLLVSPYKDKMVLKKIGTELAKTNDLVFLEDDLQADNAYYQSQVLAKKLGLYRQKFCGCEFSRHEH